MDKLSSILSLSRSFLDRSVDLSSGWLCETSHARTMTACFRVASVGVRKGRGMTKLEDVGKTSFIQQEIYIHMYINLNKLRRYP